MKNMRGLYNGTFLQKENVVH